MKICNVQDIELLNEEKDCKKCVLHKTKDCVKVEIITADQLLTVEEMENAVGLRSEQATVFYKLIHKAQQKRAGLN